MTPTQEALAALREIAGGIRLYGAPDQNLLAGRIEKRLDELAFAAGEAVSSIWEGTEEWMPLAWELCANECGEEACAELIWEGGTVPEPWGERWLKYEDQAREMIALVRKHVPSLALSQPAVGAQPLPAQTDHTYLCRAWGETDLPVVAIAKSRDEVRQFYIDQWLGDENDAGYDGTPTLPGLMQEFDEHDWRDEPEITYTFEIGGVSVERVFA